MPQKRTAMDFLIALGAFIAYHDYTPMGYIKEK
jgi:hypothetical protein